MRGNGMTFLVYGGATALMSRSYARDHLRLLRSPSGGEVPLRDTGKLNLTGITDAVSAANTQSLAVGSLRRTGYWLCNVSQGNGSAGFDVARMAPALAGLAPL